MTNNLSLLSLFPSSSSRRFHLGVARRLVRSDEEDEALALYLEMQQDVTL